ncbi:MAG: hypothetical protein SA339_09600 [Methanomassiliicoccus sp.]|nr:hypothetical protein [Methanomassiliicoccus sp.]
MATIFVSAAVLILSMPRTNGSQEVTTYPVNISITTSFDYHTTYSGTTGMEAWTYTTAVPANHYGEMFYSSYTGESQPRYDIRVTVTCDKAFVGSDITIGYIGSHSGPGTMTPGTGATYINLNVQDGTQVDSSTWTSSMVIHSNDITDMFYWMQITPYLESAHFTLTYQAIQAEV